MLRDVTAWVLTDGKAGDEVQCLGVTDALGLTPDIRRVAPRPAFAWAMPWGPIDPRDAPAREGSPIRPPYPDLLVASGRRAVPYVRAVRRLSRGHTYTVILKDPRNGSRAADLVWTPEHDRLRGDNVLVTLTSPHRISAGRLASARAAPDPRLSSLPHPRVAVLAGGDSRHHRFTPDDIARLVRDLEALMRAGATPMITASRRTPAPLRDALKQLAARSSGFFWDGDGENPYLALLALADAIVVTADSANMVGEAAATGAPVLVFEPSGGHPKLRAFIRGLERHGAVKPFTGRLEPLTYEPIDSTPIIAAAVEAGFIRHRATRDASAPVQA